MRRLRIKPRQGPDGARIDQVATAAVGSGTNRDIQVILFIGSVGQRRDIDGCVYLQMQHAGMIGVAAQFADQLTLDDGLADRNSRRQFAPLTDTANKSDYPYVPIGSRSYAAAAIWSIRALSGPWRGLIPSSRSALPGKKTVEHLPDAQRRD